MALDSHFINTANMQTENLCQTRSLIKVGADDRELLKSQAVIFNRFLDAS